MRTRTFGGVAAACALAMSACDGTSVVTSPGIVSTAPTVVASIGLSSASRASTIVFVGAPPPIKFCDLVISTSAAVDLQQVTIHMINGTNLGGPMITFPSAELTNLFGTTHVMAGAPRTFSMPLSLPDPLPAHSLGATIGFADVHGFIYHAAAIGVCP